MKITRKARGPMTLTVAANDAGAKVKGRADYACDGTADNVEIQAAIDALPAGGGTVVLSEGTFTLAAKLKLPSLTRLQGQGMGITILQALSGCASWVDDADDYAGVHMIVDEGSNQTDITLEDLTVDANETTVSSFPGGLAEANSHAIYFSQVTRLNIRRVRVISAIRWSIHVHRCLDAHVEECNVLSGQAGASPARDEQDGIHLTECERFWVERNVVNTNGSTAGVGDDAIAIRQATASSNPVKDGVVRGNIVSSEEHGIALVLAEDQDMINVVVDHNIIHDCQSIGLYLKHDSATGLWRNVSLDHNVIRDQTDGGHSIYVESPDNVDSFDGLSISYNHIYENAVTGIIGIGVEQGKDLALSHNRIEGVHTGRCIRIGTTNRHVIRFSCDGNIVDVSTSAETSHVGIMVENGSRGSVRGNSVLGNSDCYVGIWLFGASTAYNSVVGNIIDTITKAGAYGILEDNSANSNRIGPNTIVNCTRTIGVTGLPGDVISIVLVIDHASLTDGGVATAYMDFAETIPAGSIIKAVKCDFTELFNSDDTTTLTMMVGPQADLDAFSKTADPGDNAFNHTTDVFWGESDCQEPVVTTAAAPRVTFTEDDDGTDIINSTNAQGAVTITITYMKA